MADQMYCVHVQLDDQQSTEVKQRQDPRHQLSKDMVQRLTLANGTVQFSDIVNNLGIWLDSQLTMATHSAPLSQSCFFQLRQLRSIKQSLTIKATKTSVHIFVGSL